ncbi:MAG TPA: cytochrome d ubiquinol oxidase subunit II [Candidatus Acidoferrum sp.]|nr:cytochrome d ubiquinol oxidase subunit II [Candidatus Acidoferrum sp.]
MEHWLPLLFAAVCGLALLMYVVLDGYDLGVGLLLPLADDDEKDRMIASIGPFWDANETWIVLGVGVLLIAFPAAHGIILTSLYLPSTLMLMGLVLRGIAFDFRVKAGDEQKRTWNAVFSLGSLIAALCQGWMLGSYITGLGDTALNLLFALLTALSLPALYVMLGAVWLLCKTDGTLPKKARRWALRGWIPLGFALLVISLATPLVSDGIAHKWFALPQLLWVSPIPLVAAACYLWSGLALSGRIKGRPAAIFGALAIMCLMSAAGLGYSLYPDIIPGRLRIVDAAAAPESLLFTLWGVLLTVPFILGYTVFVYRIFSGRGIQQQYD